MAKFRLGDIKKEVILAYDDLPHKFTSSDLEKTLLKYGLKTNYQQRHSEIEKMKDFGMIRQIKESSHYWIKEFPDIKTYFESIVYLLEKEKEKKFNGN